ncbi:MAG TPA: DUF938 domain-containing protein [Steroidobacteraceae bacterium]|nr:DUF938 domain-containing protein [Steroidobacteraceae bacterium]
MDDLPFSAACERNKEPILAVLRVALEASNRVLEIGSGTGQHAVHFARNLPHLVWQPTDRSDYLPGLRARIAAEGPPNLLPAIELDVRHRPWPVEPPDAVFTANTFHIMSWPEVVAFFEGLHDVLAPEGLLAVYGPFNYDGEFTAPSNAAFDAQLRERDPLSGLRDIEAVHRLASSHGLRRLADHTMPANNRLALWRRIGG